MTVRKTWRVVYPNSPDDNLFPSERWAYDFVDILRRHWAKGEPYSTGSLTVQVDEGFGWQPYEHIDFAEEA
jgi:hypothetical protein